MARQPTTVQSILVSRARFPSLSGASRWVRSHGYSDDDADVSDDDWRFRQRAPTTFYPGSFRTIELTRGVKAVVGHKLQPKKATVRKGPKKAKARR